MARKPGRMANLGNQTFERTNVELSDDEAHLLLTTNIDWEKLRPEVADQEVYDKLIAVVEESTQKNESIALLKIRLKAIGKEGFSLAKKVADLIL